MADCTQVFSNFLVDQTPHFAPDILRAFHPMSGTWLSKVKTKSWPSFMGNTQYFDKFEQVFANPTRQWTPKEYEECEGTPCDPNPDKIGWGNSRYVVFKETRSIETKLLCFDQIRDVSHAKEHVAQIISDILRPATDTIMSYYMKKRAATHAKRKIVAGSAMSTFTFDWVLSGDDEIYIDADVAPDDVYKITPQLLQRQVMPLTLEGYMENRVLGNDFPRLMELITDMETTWELDKQANTVATGSVGLNALWRYTDWTTANQYWKYGFSGQLGNYAVSVDPFALRFQYYGKNQDGTYRYQVILPYRNVTAEDTDGTEQWKEGHGLRMEPNPDYETAQFQFSYIWHRGAGVAYVADAESVHPEMPFMARDLAGKWYFSNTELGCENVRKNKGKFWADFELAWKAEHPEWSVLFFHKREPACVPDVYPCVDDPEYTTQYYDSENDECDLWWDAGEDCERDEGIQILDGGITVDGFPLAFGGTNCVATVALLAAALAADPVTAALGTWESDDMDGDKVDELVLRDPTVSDVDVTITCCELLQ